MLVRWTKYMTKTIGDKRIFWILHLRLLYPPNPDVAVYTI